MKKSLLIGVAVLGVAAVAGAAVWSAGGGDFFKGSLKNLPQAAQKTTSPVPVSTAGKPEVPGKTDQFIRLGNKCLMFQPMNLAKEGNDAFIKLEPGTNFLNGIKAVNCDANTKMKNLTVKFKGANIELGSIKLKKDNVDLNALLSESSIKLMSDLQAQMKGDAEIERDVQFQFSKPIELSSDAVISLEADVKMMNQDSHMSTEMMFVDYDAQLSSDKDVVMWEGDTITTNTRETMMKDSNMMQMKIDKSGRQNLSDSLDAIELQGIVVQ